MHTEIFCKKNYVYISYICALEKCMSFTNNARKLELLNQFLKAFKDHDHAYISLEPSSGAWYSPVLLAFA